MFHDRWLVQHDRQGRVIKVGATVRVASENVIGTVRSIGTRAWLDVGGCRRGFAFGDLELLSLPKRNARGRPSGSSVMRGSPRNARSKSQRAGCLRIS